MKIRESRKDQNFVLEDSSFGTKLLITLKAAPTRGVFILVNSNRTSEKTFDSELFTSSSTWYVTDPTKVNKEDRNITASSFKPSSKATAVESISL